MVSQPVKAVILLFPITEPYENKRREEDIWIAGSGQHPIDPTVFWMKQTVCLAIYWDLFFSDENLMRTEIP